MPSINDLTTAELLSGYNAMTGSAVKRFTSRSVGVERIGKAIAEQGKTEADFVAIARPEAPVEAPVEAFDLTENELHALYWMTVDALAGCGGERPSFFEIDEYTWCDTGSLVARGWGKESAAGTFGSLVEKGAVGEVDTKEFAVETKAWRWLDTNWDDLTKRFLTAVEVPIAPAPKKTRAKPTGAANWKTPATGDAIKLPRSGSKKAALLDAMLRPEGVPLGELKEITGWKAIPRVTATRVASQAGYKIEKIGEGLSQVWRAV